jgi:choline dehydrogenase-like flavoprotein
VPNYGQDRVDVLVVGAGPSGGVVAKVLSGAGYSVLCLEQGPWVNASDYPGDKAEFPLLAAREWHWNPNVRRRPEDYPCEVSEADIVPLMANAVGGSTIHYAAQWLRLLPSDFRTATMDRVADDWPLSYSELLPYYETVESWMGVSGVGGDTAYPLGNNPPLPGLPIGNVGRVAARGMNASGWHWWPGTHAIASQTYGRLKPCARRAVCAWGCPEGAKGSADITLWPDAITNGARIITGARVREITINSAGLATGVVWVDRRGVAHHQDAEVVVLAANAVGTARLLLLSQSVRFPNGLANSSGFVGRRLMMHPAAGVLGIYDDLSESWLGPNGSPVYSLQFAEGDSARGFPRGSKWEACPIPGPVELLGRYSSLPFADRLGSQVNELVKDGLGRSFEWELTVEDLPDLQNRVLLDPTLTDGDGIPAPKIVYKVSEVSRTALRWNVERAVEAHRAGGAHAVVVNEWLPECGWHLLGTARMGTSPSDSVVGPFGQTHDVPNLYVVDGSLFVTSASVNPTATICAIALRCAEHMHANAPSQRTPL